MPRFRTALVVAAICIVHAIATIILSLTIVRAHPLSRQFWAVIFGIVAAILSSIQYFPQTYTTFNLRRVGSLSIPMMCIQTPGSLVWAGSLAARLGTPGWSSWGVYVVTALLQGTLLVMGIYFEYISPRKGEGDLSSDESQDEGYDANYINGLVGINEEEELSEETPLLQGSG